MVPLMLLLSQLVGLEGHFLVISPTTQLELLIFAGPIVLMLFLSFYFFFNESPVYPKKKRKRMSCLSWFKIFHCKCRFPRLRHKNHILCSYLFFFGWVLSSYPPPRIRACLGSCQAQLLLSSTICPKVIQAPQFWAKSSW